MDDWIGIYQSYTPLELDAEIARLKAQALSPFNAQTEGQRSYSRSTSEIRDRLSAAIQVKRGDTEPRHGRADFSEVQP